MTDTSKRPAPDDAAVQAAEFFSRLVRTFFFVVVAVVRFLCIFVLFLGRRSLGLLSDPRVRLVFWDIVERVSLFLVEFIARLNPPDRKCHLIYLIYVTGLNAN